MFNQFFFSNYTVPLKAVFHNVNHVVYATIGETEFGGNSSIISGVSP